MNIDEQSIKHVAKLAKLSFKENEVRQFTEKMGSIIEMVEELNELDTTDVPGTYHGITIDSVMRDDVAQQGTDRELLFKNVKTAKDGMIEVPEMLDNGGEGA
ncbi:Asp-tRNA(Asn)/Glu-tRNA(Gln) amidotransferase subunit GatC [Lacticigenium naphthae]|uniref:Asp-tRNA(Asn)/Glu-tRNA(Gln) amidotransferase subunit GatC n=1 Tax=Lacticigenium naphthae TaxID=515351 RepID=UPI0004064648|nr:Asp-tRNA(Asn)/Glu-tRNA(Gln) amidotransferase subunit GatC [Lacticigenium naphthae]